VFTKACEACGGGGRLEMEPCRTCGGVGTSIRNEVVTLTVPPGVEPGTRMAVPGRGHAGARGGPAGDLYVTLDVTPDPVFRREGRDLIVTVPVAVHEAALGARIEVPTLDGPARLRVPRGVQSGQRLRLRGQGIGSAGSDPSHAGDLVVELQIVLPPQLDERSQALIEEFGRRNAGDVRRHLFN
jgi:molecular chaperone DnaJ